MKNPIRFSEALDLLNATVVGTHRRAVKLVFCTADRTRSTGGDRVVFDRAVLLKPLGKAPEGKKGQNMSVHTRRYPIHMKNLTTGDIRKVYLDLIETVNDHPIL